MSFETPTARKRSATPHGDDSLRPNETSDDSWHDTQQWSVPLRSRTDSNGSTSDALYHRSNGTLHVAQPHATQSIAHPTSSDYENFRHHALSGQISPSSGPAVSYAPLESPAASNPHSAFAIQLRPQRHDEFFPSNANSGLSRGYAALPHDISSQGLPLMYRDEEGLAPGGTGSVWENPQNRSFAMYYSMDDSNSLLLSHSQLGPNPSYGISQSLYGADFSESVRGHPWEPHPPFEQSQNRQMQAFSSMVRDMGAASPDQVAAPVPVQSSNQGTAHRIYSTDASDETPSTNQSHDTAWSRETGSDGLPRPMSAFDLGEWLARDAAEDNRKGCHYLIDRANASCASFIRHYFYNPLDPEFTSLQQFDWAVALGVCMGFFTAYWKRFIDFGVEFVWVTLPERLLAWGVFTDPEGWFPLYHYTWMTPATFGGLLSYAFVVLQCPDQNQWITSIHARGVQNHDTFVSLFFLSTAGMWSGMSLGPELPLVLLGGMVGSRLAIATQQSILQARVMNLTAASAAVSGFFGFPMAGAMFVLEL
jgi:Voltage gated chloride channel